MVEEQPEGIVIGNVGQMGNLDRLFDLTEKRLYRDTADMVEVASYDDEASQYEVVHPLTGRTGYRVNPRLLHGFLGMRYQEMGSVGVYIPGQNIGLQEYLRLAGLATSGRWEIEGGELSCDWVVKKAGGVHKAVILGGSLTTNEWGLKSVWILQKYPMTKMDFGNVARASMKKG